MKTDSLIRLLTWCALLSPSGSLTAQSSFDFVVARDGSGSHATIQEAVNACRDYAEREFRILVRNGVYREKLVIPASKNHIHLTGESAEGTVLEWNDYSGKVDSLTGVKFSTFTSFTCLVAGNSNSIENMSIVNSAGQVGQAVALHVEGDKCVFRNVRLIGNQDTHLASGQASRQYYVKCTIEGTTDFIFGAATAMFDSCTIISKRDSYITAASTLQERSYGFVFRHCRLLADSAHRNVYLGRPWRLHAATVFIECYLGPHIRPEGWHNWNKPEAEQTARYAEYRNTGPGANPSSRVPWSRQLTDREASAVTLESVLGGADRWNPLLHR